MLPILRSSLCLSALIFFLADGGSFTDKTALVTVLAEGGTPIRELKAADFIVKEDGRTREVVDAKLAPDQLSVALLLETAQPARGVAFPTNVLRAAASSFVHAIHAVNPDARVALWQYASAAAVTVDFTNKPDELENAIARLYPSQQTGGVLLEALDGAAKQLAGRPTSRRAIVCVDFNSPEGSTDRMLQQSADSITNSGATLWAVSVRGGGVPSPNREEVLDRMTKANGGKRYQNADASGLESTLKKIAASLTSQYVVTFTHPGEGQAKTTTFETVGGPKVLLTPFMR
jgi:hypothetical protein